MVYKTKECQSHWNFEYLNDKIINLNSPPSSFDHDGGTR